MKISSTFPQSFNLQEGKISFRDITVAPSKKTNIHNHHDRECWSVLSGEGVLSSGTLQQTIRAGDHIEFMPFESHTVENQGIEVLRFTSYWYFDRDVIACDGASSASNDGHLMIETAFPTPNGPLHLGHLSGAYLLADTLKRCCELTGANSFSFCGTYGHTNHIDKTAASKGTTYAHLVKSSEGIIGKDLEMIEIEYDVFLPHFPASDAFDTVKNEFIERLLKSEYLFKKTVEHPYSESCQQFVSESNVAGKCPHCSNTTIGIECEKCGLYQDECNLIEPFHSLTKEQLINRPVDRLYLRLDRDIIGEMAARMYGYNTASCRICYDRLLQFLNNGSLSDIPVSSLRGRGVLVNESQVLTIVMERALRSFFGLSQYPCTTRHLFFCGVDNLCASGILMPYILKILGIPKAQLPVAVINHFCLLENRKFSTGGNHAIWASEFLQAYPPDVVRLYLCHIHSPTSDSNFRPEAFFDFSNRIVEMLINLFTNGHELASLAANSRIEAGPWLKQDIVFYRESNEAMGYCIESYASHSPSVAVHRIVYLLESMFTYIAQSYAYRDDHNMLRTKIALILHAYQCLAYCLYPAMPALGAHIFDCLDDSLDRSHVDRSSLRIIEFANTNIESIIESLCNMKQKVSLT